MPKLAFSRFKVVLAVVFALTSLSADAREGEYVAGYLIIPTGERLAPIYNAGFSMYVPAWPLLSHYPGHQFQTGLPGTWMFAQYDGPAPKDMYSDVEGGLGWWRGTRFPTTTPKFIMGGVGPNFSEIADGPGHGAGSWNDPHGLYGVAQLSPWLLFPPDGLNIKQGTRGELFGYGYLNLPLADPKPTTDGKPIPTGDHCWTLFLNTKNFKGPVAFFTPHFWSHAAAKDSSLAGKLLDTRPSEPNMEIQMETQYIPCRIATAANGEQYARISPTSFPINAGNRSALVHQSTRYAESALRDAVKAWFSGGPPSTGRINPAGARVRTFSGDGYETWEVRTPNKDGSESKASIVWRSFGTPVATDPFTYGYKWNLPRAKGGDRLVRLPEYFHLENARDPKQARWVSVTPSEVPPDTGLQNLSWATPKEDPQESFTTPSDLSSVWKHPGPVAGPFRAHLGDGTMVTYYWYRFADQPAMLMADLSDAERERMQKRVELIHRAWPKNHEYLVPPKIGTLASIDPALIVEPPKGLEYGYVPIATRQELPKK